MLIIVHLYSDASIFLPPVEVSDLLSYLVLETSFYTNKQFKAFNILGDPGADSRDDTMFVVKVYCKIATSLWALSLTEPVPEAFESPASDWPEKNFSGQSAKRSSRVTLVFPYTT